MKGYLKVLNESNVSDTKCYWAELDDNYLTLHTNKKDKTPLTAINFIGKSVVSEFNLDIGAEVLKIYNEAENFKMIVFPNESKEFYQWKSLFAITSEHFNKDNALSVSLEDDEDGSYVGSQSTTELHDEIKFSSSEDHHKRTPPQKISVEDKARLIKASQNGDQVLDVAKLLGIRNKNTVYNIISRYHKLGVISKGKSGGCRPKRMTDEVGDKLLEYVDQNARATLSQMQVFLQSLDVNVTPSTISNFLKRKCVTFKKKKACLQNISDEQIKELRFEYVSKMLDNGWRSSQCIFIDETSLNTWVPNHNKQYKRCKLLNGSNPSISMVIAFSRKGVVYHKSCVGAINELVYHEFVMELSAMLPETRHFLISDKETFHNKNIATHRNHEVVCLPPGSPFLNPIHSYFQTVKTKLRQNFIHAGDIVDLIPTRKLEKLKHYFEEILRSDNNIDLKKDFHDVEKYFPKCILKLDIDD